MKNKRTEEGWETALSATCTAWADAVAQGDDEAAEGWWKLAEWQQRNLAAAAEGGLRPS